MSFDPHSFFAVDRQACRRVYRDKHIVNHYWVVDRMNVKQLHRLTPLQYGVISAACRYNTTLYNYLKAVEEGKA